MRPPRQGTCEFASDTAMHVRRSVGFCGDGRKNRAPLLLTNQCVSSTITRSRGSELETFGSHVRNPKPITPSVTQMWPPISRSWLPQYKTHYIYIYIYIYIYLSPTCTLPFSFFFEIKLKYLIIIYGHLFAYMSCKLQPDIFRLKSKLESHKTPCLMGNYIYFFISPSKLALELFQLQTNMLLAYDLFGL
jgi:hypothetical protein